MKVESILNRYCHLLIVLKINHTEDYSVIFWITSNFVKWVQNLTKLIWLKNKILLMFFFFLCNIFVVKNYEKLITFSNLGNYKW